MRIAYFTNQYPATSHTFIRREMRAMETRGHTILRYALRCTPKELVDPDDIAEMQRTNHVLLLPKAQLLKNIARSVLSNPGAFLRAAVTATRYSGRSTRGFLVHLAYLAEALVLADWFRRDDVEHIHVHFGTNPATVAALVHDLTGLPFSITVHGPEEFDRPHENALGMKTAAASFVAAISSHGRSQLMRWADHEDWHKLHVVHCGLDAAYRTQPPPKQPSNTFLCIGRYSEQKGHLLLIDAAAMLRDRGAQFQIRLAGDGPLRHVMEAKIQYLGLSNHVLLLGTLSQRNIREEIQNARALVLPSFAEGLPVALMEAMALATPTISTFVAGIPELVESDNGWLVPAGDAGALAFAMKKALAVDAPTLAAMGAHARARAMTRHDIAASARLLERHIARTGFSAPADTQSITHQPTPASL